MRFCVIRHPEAGAGISAESALPLWESRGWTRASNWADDPAVFNTSGQIQIPEIYALDDSAAAPAAAEEPTLPDVELAPEPAVEQAGNETVSNSKEN